MKEKIKGIPRNMAFNVIGGIIILLALFGMILSSLGLISFTNSYKKGYSKSTFHIAETAASLVNGDHLRLYLDGEFPSEYAQTKHYRCSEKEQHGEKDNAYYEYHALAPFPSLSLPISPLI